MENYEQKYKEALDRCKRKYEFAKNEGANGTMVWMEEIFPELKESEDERIRKGLIDFLKSPFVNENITDEKVTPWIAWLEKQGEQNTNEIHPIFRVGDYIKNKKTSDKVLIEQLDIATKAYCYVSYDGGAEIHSDFSFSKQDEWMLIGQNIVEQKNWSEEDEDVINHLLAICSGAKRYRQFAGCLQDDITKYQTWLKSLKDRVQLQPQQEWSEQDEKMLKSIISDYDDMVNESEGFAPLCNRRNWLKSLKERYTWKPSEGQLECLEYAIEKAEKDWSPLTNNRIYLTLKALKKQLKKL